MMKAQHQRDERLERMDISAQGEQQVMLSIMENKKRENKLKTHLMEENQR